MPKSKLKRSKKNLEENDQFEKPHSYYHNNGKLGWNFEPCLFYILYLDGGDGNGIEVFPGITDEQRWAFAIS